MTRRILLLALTAALTMPLLAQQQPTRERGFKPESVYQFNGLDTVSLMNGNMSMAIPLGTSYPVGGNLSYSFTLRYLGNAWHMRESCSLTPNCKDDTITWLWRAMRDNAGLAWHISFGDMLPPGAGEAGTSGTMWRYRSPDGGTHHFYDTLHEPACTTTLTQNCDPKDTNVFYTRDATYLRLRKTTDTAVIIDFPDGQRHRYQQYANGDWRIAFIYDAFSPLDATGIPSSNYVRFDYELNASGVNDTKVTDSHGRVHWIRFRPGSEQNVGIPIVDKVELTWFGRDPAASGSTPARAVYDFAYNTYTTDASGNLVDGANWRIAKPCGGGLTDAKTATVAMLRRLSLPSGETFDFAYDAIDYADPSTATCNDKSGTLTSAQLPTKGTIEWDYQEYPTEFTAPSANVIGVGERRLRHTDGTISQRTLYSSDSSGQRVVETLVPSGSTWRADSKTESYFRWRDFDQFFGLPFTSNTALQDGGRYLSTRTFDCDPALGTCSGTPAKATYVLYEADPVATGCHVDLPCYRDRNFRVSSTRDKFDGVTYADTDHSGFDGYGHYRTATSGGNFTSGNISSKHTDFNSGADATGRANGLPLIRATDSWILNTYPMSYVLEGTSRVTVQACFDKSTGFLTRRRSLSNTSLRETSQADDLLAVFTRGTGSGDVTREEYFGGDLQPLGTGSLCSLSLPAHNSYSYSLKHEYDYGVRARSSYENTSGTVLGFKVADDTIDRWTGLVSTSRDTAGVATTFDYDIAGRIKTITGAQVAPVTYSYTAATLSPYAPAKVEMKTTSSSGTIGGNAIFQYDGLGRLWREKKLMPDDSWSIRQTVYNPLGLKSSVSEFEKLVIPAGGTEFQFVPSRTTKYAGYDALGRAGSIEAPDGKKTTFSYTDARKTRRTVNVKTGATTFSDVTVEEEVDRAGRLIRVTEASGTANAQDTTYAYDAAGRLTGVTMGVQNRTFTYDGRGLLLSEQHPESGSTSYDYDARGHARTRTTSEGTVSTDYDRAERVTAVRAGDANVKVFTYDGTSDSLGKVHTATRYNASHAELGGQILVTESFTYGGPGGRLSQKTTTLKKSSDGVVSTLQTFTDSYGYDSFGAPARTTYPSCDTCSGLDAPARSVTSAYTYGLLSGVGSYTRGITYHPNGLVYQLRHANAGSTTSGPTMTQTLADGMTRPGSLSVTGFCESFVISTQPQSQSITTGQSATLSVAASGATSYQWFRVDGATSVALNATGSSLTVTPTTTTTYWVRVSNGTCSRDSDRATVTVGSCPAPAATISTVASMDASGQATASVPATTGATYAWTVSGGTVVSGAGTATLTFRAGCNSTVTLSVTVTASCGASTTRSATVAVNPATAAVSGTSSISAGGSATITAAITGTGPWQLTWSDGVVQSVSASPATRTVSPASTTTYSVTSVRDSGGCTGTASGSATVTVKPAAPTSVVATATSATSVAVSWSYSGPADSFRVERCGAGVCATFAATSSPYPDTTAVSGRAYVYRVYAVRGGTASDPSVADLATTVIFSDDPIASGVTPLQRAHIEQLRIAVNAVRTCAGLGQSTFTDSDLTGKVMRSVHINELRTALDQARSALSLMPAGYTNAPLSSGVGSFGRHVTELRGGVR